MGWRKVEQDGTWRWRDDSDDCWPNCLASSTSTAGYEIEDVEPWSPSTDIKAAWEIVEKMMEMPGDVPYHFAGKIESCCGIKSFWDDDFSTFYILKNLTPEIICRAALKAVGVTEVPD